MLFSAVQNSYVNIAVSRMLEILIAVELTLGLTMLMAITSHVFTKSSTAVTQITILTFLSYVFTFYLLDAGKVPFDLVEAESELIDGVTTEFEGFAFSLVYAAEVTAGFIGLKMFS